MNPTACLQALNITHHQHIIDGNEYVIATGTGDGAFLYDYADVEAESVRWMRLDADGGPWSYDDRYSYQEFCDHTDPLTGVKDGPGDQHMTWEAAVIVAATEGINLNNPGACTPMLTAAEFDICLLAGRAADTKLRVTYYAICGARSPDRATVIQLYGTAEELRAAHEQMGDSRLDLIAVASERPLAIGQRIWHGAQAIGITEVRPDCAGSSDR